MKRQRSKAELLAHMRTYAALKNEELTADGKAGLATMTILAGR